MKTLGLALCLLGAVVLLIAAWGVVRLPDALSRQHAATKAGTLALAVFALGAGVLMPDPAWIGRLVLLVLLLLLTLPLASHALVRAAVREVQAAEVEEGGNRSDESPRHEAPASIGYQATRGRIEGGP